MISKHITLTEATKSNTATRLGINNTPNEATIETMKLTAEKVFEPLREILGAIRVSSFYRSPDLNRAIGGSKSSQHCKGEAIDMEALVYLLQGMAATAGGLLVFYVAKFLVEVAQGKFRN